MIAFVSSNYTPQNLTVRMAEPHLLILNTSATLIATHLCLATVCRLLVKRPLTPPTDINVLKPNVLTFLDANLCPGQPRFLDTTQIYVSNGLRNMNCTEFKWCFLRSTATLAFRGKLGATHHAVDCCLGFVCNLAQAACSPFIPQLV